MADSLSNSFFTNSSYRLCIHVDPNEGYMVECAVHLLTNFRANLVYFPTRPSFFELQPPPLNRKPEERAQIYVDRSYKRKSERLYTGKTLPDHHFIRPRPGRPHNPLTRQHYYSQMACSFRESRLTWEPRKAYPSSQIRVYAS